MNKQSSSVYPLRNPSSCTRCPYNGTKSPCFECPSNTQLSNAGKCWLSLDALPPGLQPRPSTDYQLHHISTSESVTNISPEAEDYLRKLLASLAQLSKGEILLLHGLLNGMTLTDMGRDYFGGITKQAVGSRFRTMRRKHPFVAVLSPIKDTERK